MDPRLYWFVPIIIFSLITFGIRVKSDSKDTREACDIILSLMWIPVIILCTGRGIYLFFQ